MTKIYENIINLSSYQEKRAFLKYNFLSIRQMNVIHTVLATV